VTYQCDAVPGREGEYVRAGDDAEAGLLHARLDAVDDLESPEAGVGHGVLLRRVALRRVDQHRRVAPLRACQKTNDELSATS
jgi:hypothetical protein